MRARRDASRSRGGLSGQKRDAVQPVVLFRDSYLSRDHTGNRHENAPELRRHAVVTGTGRPDAAFAGGSRATFVLSAQETGISGRSRDLDNRASWRGCPGAVGPGAHVGSPRPSAGPGTGLPALPLHLDPGRSTARPGRGDGPGHLRKHSAGPGEFLSREDVRADVTRDVMGS